MLVSLLFAVLTSLVWIVSIFRRCRQAMDVLTRRLRLATRTALAVFAVAVIAALWLAAAGEVLAVTSSPAIIPVAVAIYATAWSGVLLTPFAVWGAIRSWRQTIGTRAARVHQTLAAIAAVLLAAFCLGWHVAGTSLRF